jgi:hypothetical protein
MYPQPNSPRRSHPRARSMPLAQSALAPIVLLPVLLLLLAAGGWR